MTTRDVLRWHFSALDILQLAGIALAGAALGMLDQVGERLERFIDRTAGEP